MKIIYLAKSFDKKPTSKDAKVLYSKTTPKYEHTVNNLSDIVQIYTTGYSFRLAKVETKTQFIVLDIDDCSVGTREAIQSYIIKNTLTDTWYCDYSASMKETKCKVFVWLDSAIEATKSNLRQSTERIIEILKKEVSEYCSHLTCDDHQINNPKQLTYGLPQKKSFISSELEGLPLFEEDISTVWLSDRVLELNEQCRVLPLLNEFKYDKANVANTDYFNIPINKWEFNEFLKKWRPDVFHDDIGYVNQLLTVFDTYYCKDGKCCMKRFNDGHRHWVADSITVVIAMNTVILKLYYNVDITVNDSMQSLAKWIKYSFDKKDGKHWLLKDGYFKKYQDKMLKAIESILNDTDWSEYKATDNLKEYITSHHNTIPELIKSYKPQNKALRIVRNDFRTNVLPKINDLYKYDYEMIVDLIESYYDRVDPSIKDNLIELAIKEARKDQRNEFFGRRLDFGRKHNITKERSDKGKKRMKERIDKGTKVNNYIVVDGAITIPRDKVTPSIKASCSRNRIKIIRI